MTANRVTQPPRPDVLAGLSANQRLRREAKDAEFLAKVDNVERLVDVKSMERDLNTWAGISHGVFGPFNLKPYAGETVDFAICARYDLEHPLYFPDNTFTDCVDCGCNLQVRPDCPPGKRVCACCAARRIREMPPE